MTQPRETSIADHHSKSSFPYGGRGIREGGVALAKSTTATISAIEKQHEGSFAGSFAESISIPIQQCNRPVDDDDSCISNSSSSSDGESLPHLHPQELGSFPSCTSPCVENSSLVGGGSTPLPVVFEEDDECETSVSNTEEEDALNEEKKDEIEVRSEILERNDIIDIITKQQPQRGEKDETTTKKKSLLCITPQKLFWKENSAASALYPSNSSNATVGSNTDATCQTAPISLLSQDSTSEASTDNNNDHHHPSSSESVYSPRKQDELDSRLNAILALKEVVFAQRVVIKESSKDKQRLTKKMTQRNVLNKELYLRNKDLEKQLANMKEQLRVANLNLKSSRPIQLQTLTHSRYEESDDADDERSIKNKADSSIFVRLHRINEKRKMKGKGFRRA